MVNVWAIVTAVGIFLLAVAALGTLTLLYAQVRVMRRVAAGPLLLELLREHQALGGALTAVGAPGAFGPAQTTDVERLLQFHGRVEQLIVAGALEPAVAHHAFGESVGALLDDERVRRELARDRSGRYAEAVALHQRFGGSPKGGAVESIEEGADRAE